MNIRIIKLDKDQVPLYLLYEADPSREAVADYLERGIIYGAVSGENIVGISVLLRTRPFTMELVNLSVDEKYQNKGIGKRLIANAIDAARENECRILEVGTGNAGIGQLAMYQKCGFSITSVDFDFFRKHYPEKIVENGIECRHMIRFSMDV